MSLIQTGRRPAVAAAMMGAVGFLSAQAMASLTYDASLANPAAPTDGTGVWDTTTANWSNGTADVVWPNTGSDIAVFGNNGGTAGVTNNYAITVAAGGVNAGGITFNALANGNSSLHSTDYQLSGGAITLGLASTAVIVNNTSSINVTTYPDAVISSVLTGGGGLTESGAGVLTINANNTYTGATTINGTVYIGARGTGLATAFGALTSAVTLNGASVTNNMASGIVALSNGSFTNSGSSGIYGNNKSQTTLGAVGSTFGGSGTLTFGIGAGTSNIAADFTNYNGILLVNGGGTLREFVSASVSNKGSFTGGAGVALDIEGATTVSVPSSNGVGNTVTFGSLTSTSTTAILGGSASGGTITYAVGALGTNTSYLGAITGNAALTKNGNGTLTLATAGNSFTGATTINAGTLFVNGSTTVTATTIAAAGTLGGGGTVTGAVTNNGTIAPGATAATIGTLNLGTGLTFGDNSIYSLDLNTAGNSDLLAITGNLVLGNNDTLNVNLTGLAASSAYTIATYTGALTGTFVAPAGYTVGYGTGVITLTATPEPASFAMVGIIAGGLIARRRRA